MLSFDPGIVGGWHKKARNFLREPGGKMRLKACTNFSPCTRRTWFQRKVSVGTVIAENFDLQDGLCQLAMVT